MANVDTISYLAMRFRLRTLLIVLATGPMVLAGGWWISQESRLFKFCLLACCGAFVLGLATVILDAFERGRKR